MQIWVTSDTHFYHGNIIKYCNRPYVNIESMNRDIVQRWNVVVQPQDLVYHLGDVGFGSLTAIGNLVQELNGTKVLIRGNHDRKGIPGFADVLQGHTMDHNGTQVQMVHDSRKLLRSLRPGTQLGLCGHVHTAWTVFRSGCRMQDPQHAAGVITPIPLVNVGVDMWNFTPQRIEDLIQAGLMP